jgi:hypothetical protein
MDPKLSTTYFAPSATGAVALQFPGVRQPSQPGVDERLVQPGTRDEMLRGEVIRAQPAHPPHAEQHTRLDYVVEAHVANGYIVATDMLTRAGEGSDFATDTAVRKAGTDPTTGTRYLEELAFEVVSTQSLREIIMRAEDLTDRGVRRLLAIFVGRREVCEWSRTQRCFVTLSPDDAIEDPTLARPLPVRALLDRLQADNAVIDALDSKDNPRLRSIQSHEREQAFEQGLEQGLEQGRLEALELACLLLDIELTPERRAHLRALDAAGLQRLREQLELERRWPG